MSKDKLTAEEFCKVHSGYYGETVKEMISLIGVYLDTRTNDEDFAVTPYLSVFHTDNGGVSATGLSITWGWWSLSLGLGINLPKGIKRFRIIKLKE